MNARGSSPRTTAPTPGRALGYLLLLDLLQEDRSSWIRFFLDEVNDEQLASDAAFRTWVTELAAQQPHLLTHARQAIVNFRASVSEGTAYPEDA